MSRGRPAGTATAVGACAPGWGRTRARRILSLLCVLLAEEPAGRTPGGLGHGATSAVSHESHPGEIAALIAEQESNHLSEIGLGIAQTIERIAGERITPPTPHSESTNLDAVSVAV